jgi:hypothetical protein
MEAVKILSGDPKFFQPYQYKKKTAFISYMKILLGKSISERKQQQKKCDILR